MAVEQPCLARRRVWPVFPSVLPTLGDLRERIGLTRLCSNKDPGASLDDLREAVRTLEDADPIARRVLGGAHPSTEGIAYDLRDVRAALRAREPKK